MLSEFDSHLPHSASPSGLCDDIRPVATPLRISGLITIGVSIVLGFAVTPILFVGVAVGLIDLVLAMAMSRGWIGRPAPDIDTADRVEADPTYNPYARED